jgi:hypothetical protein
VILPNPKRLLSLLRQVHTSHAPMAASAVILGAIVLSCCQAGAGPAAGAMALVAQPAPAEPSNKLRVEAWTVRSPGLRGTELEVYQAPASYQLSEAEVAQRGFVVLNDQRVLDFDRVVRESALGSTFTTFTDTETGHQVLVRTPDHPDDEDLLCEVEIDAEVTLIAALEPRSRVSTGLGIFGD